MTGRPVVHPRGCCGPGASRHSAHLGHPPGNGPVQCMVGPPHHARRMFGYRDGSLSSRYNSKVVTTGFYGFLRTALSHPCNDWVCVRHVHSL